MKKFVTILSILSLFAASAALAQNPVKANVMSDGTPMFKMDDIMIYAVAPTKREKRQYERQVKQFNKLRYNVLKVWPYANAAAKTLKEIESEIASIPEEKQKEYMKSKEKALFGEYEKDIRNLSISQGKILIKLIDRQTGSPTYSLIKDLKNGTSAFFWQAIGGIFGYNLKKEFDAEGDDFAVEMICRSLENGSNPTYYDFTAAKSNSGAGN
ncbi:MAG: DUF4294 domain-containing protein [Bacteroidia bacterium]|nr:DUF4294 domain-containing protein [Bacteroidia bacterium]